METLGLFLFGVSAVAFLLMALAQVANTHLSEDRRPHWLEDDDV